MESCTPVGYQRSGIIEMCKLRLIDFGALVSAVRTIQGSIIMGTHSTFEVRKQNYIAHDGLVDDAISYRKSVLVHLDSKSSVSAVNRCSFAAVTPADNEGLQLLAMLVNSLQSREIGTRTIEQQKRRSTSQIRDNPILTAHRLLDPLDTENKNTARCQLSHLEEVDQRWIKKLHAAKTAKATLANDVTQWTSFAGYVR